MGKIDLTKPVQTRDGNRAGAVRATNGRLHGYIETANNCSHGYTWEADGKGGGDPSNDLVNVPEKRTVKVWINIYPDHYDSPFSGFWRTRHEANTMQGNGRRIACIEREITFTVGEGLEP